jgi:hypothetical protein
MSARILQYMPKQCQFIVFVDIYSGAIITQLLFMGSMCVYSICEERYRRANILSKHKKSKATPNQHRSISMPRTEDPYTFLAWTAHNKRAGSKLEQAIKTSLRKKSGIVGSRFLLLYECIILTSFMIEAAIILKHVIGN